MEKYPISAKNKRQYINLLEEYVVKEYSHWKKDVN